MSKQSSRKEPERELDLAWEKYLQVKNLWLDGSSVYEIPSNELKEITGYEPRLLAKHDTPSEVPSILRRHRYALLAIKNGWYLLFPGDVFARIPACRMLKLYEPCLAFPLRPLDVDPAKCSILTMHTILAWWPISQTVVLSI
jgi:hypothetical protein